MAPVDRSHPPLIRLLGPAFVAAIAYVDPGNIAANLTAGAQHGYLLLWVLVLANLMAMLVQYLAAKLGLVTGRSLAENLGESLPRGPRVAYWIQAELVVAATDVAEVIGGAIALQILLGLPLLLGGVIIGAVSLVLLAIQQHRGQRSFEHVVMGLLAVITIGFLAGLVVDPPDARSLAGGLVPRLDGPSAIVLATGMLGATVMPHALYLHSGLVTDRHGRQRAPALTRHLLRAARWDVLLSLLLAGTVNIAMLVLAAEALPGIPGTDTIQGAHAAIQRAAGPVVGVLFGVGLLASGLASTSVGAYAGDGIMVGMLRVRVPMLARRAVTLLPALAILALGIEPTRALVLSQVVLSLGLPFALVPLVRRTGSRRVMGDLADATALRALAWTVVAGIVALNLALVLLVLAGDG